MFKFIWFNYHRVMLLLLFVGKLLIVGKLFQEQQLMVMEMQKKGFIDEEDNGKWETTKSHVTLPFFFFLFIYLIM